MGYLSQIVCSHVPVGMPWKPTLIEVKMDCSGVYREVRVVPNLSVYRMLSSHEKTYLDP